MSNITLTSAHTLGDCLQGLIRHRSKEAYAAIGQGLWLINACAIHALPVGRPSGKKNSPSVGLFLGADQNPGFEQWIVEHVTGPESPLRLSRSTVYNYMNAARNLGLKPGDGEAELKALEDRNALANRRLSDLYKLTAAEEPPAPKSAPSPPGGPEQLWLPFTAELSTLFEPESPTRKALYQVPAQELEAMETKLRFALDAIREVRSARKGGSAK